MPGKFVVKKGPTGKFRFSLLSTNGQIVASSEAYENKAAAMRGVASVQKLAADATDRRHDGRRRRTRQAGCEAGSQEARGEEAGCKKPAAKKPAAKKK